MGQQPAQADSEHKVWDRLARCESSGDWSANTGNSFYGGLQILQSTWQSFGGQRYAPRADQATREEQITVATAIQHSQGWTAWPVCSKRIGLQGRAPDAAPGRPGAGQGAADQPGSAQRPDGAAPDGPPGAGGQDGSPAAAGDSATVHTHVIEHGETLTEIAARYGVRGGWRHLYQVNKAAIGEDPDMIITGASLQVPG